MKVRRGGQNVKKGWYFDIAEKHLFYLKEDAILPGDVNKMFLSLNLLELILIVLFISACYVVFVPVLGWTLVIYAFLCNIIIFIIQKILCRAIRRLCDLEHWLCNVTNRMCKRCGKDCEDDVAMLVHGFILCMVGLIGILIGRYTR